MTARGIMVTVYHLQEDEDFTKQPLLDFSEKMADELI